MIQINLILALVISFGQSVSYSVVKKVRLIGEVTLINDESIAKLIASKKQGIIWH